MSGSDPVSRQAQLRALTKVIRFKPLSFTGVALCGLFAALLEGVGLSFIVPIVELVQSSGEPAQQAEGLSAVFLSIYQSLGIPFSLGTIVLGVSFILTVRWTSTFLVRWFREVLVYQYIQKLQRDAFDATLDAEIAFFDEVGSDNILNAIVTQAENAGQSIRYAINLIEQGLIAAVYLSVAILLAPRLAVFAIVLLGTLSYLFQNVVESGYEVGDRVAQANERIQQVAQAGTQGIRETKLYNNREETFDKFLDALETFTTSNIVMGRNQQAIQNFYNLLTAVAVFILIYLAITFANLSVGSLGVFLFAMFRLGPKASNLNSIFYAAMNNLPHLVRTQSFIDDLERNREPTTDSEPVPGTFESIDFDDVSFSYPNQQENAIDGMSFQIERGEFVGFAGRSGAGKSTIAALLSRLRVPESGDIRINNTSISKMDIDEYRSRVAIVRQDPYIFNETLEYNITIGARDASISEIERISEIACIDEFLDDLPEGYDTHLGDDGVRLSGGQRQRVALARALLKQDAELLILDEATSDLDSHLEQTVQRGIEQMDREYTIIGIAHRLSTLQNADRIYTVDDGMVAEVGQHADLVEHGGIYAELYTIQSEGV